MFIIFKITCFEIASEAILRQKQSRSSYIWSTEYCIQFSFVSYPRVDVTKSAGMKFNERK